MNISVIGGEMSKGEQQAYIDRARKLYPDKVITDIEFMIEGDEVQIAYTWETVPFERIRRITGYLVGSVTRFNDGKRAEEKDRVKHGC